MRILWVSVAVVGWLWVVSAALGQSQPAEIAATAPTAVPAAARSAATTRVALEELPPGAVDLGVKNVGIEIYGWEEPDRKFTPGPGLMSGNGSMRDQRLSGRYQMAMAGRWPPGSREVFGFVGGPYPNEASLDVIRFAREKSHISIVLRRSETGGRGDGYRSWKVAYVSALLPIDLPNGKYTVTCSVKDASGNVDPMTRATSQVDIEIPNPKEVAAAAARERLRKLSDEDVAREYLAAARALGASPLAPREVPVTDLPPYEFNDVKYLRFVEVGDEIVRRGKPMVTYLMGMLQRHAPANANNKDPHPIGLARSLTELMVRVNDPQPTALLAEVVEGMEGKVILPVRKSALEALERLTMITFRKQMLTDERARWAVEDPKANAPDRNDPVFGPGGSAGQAAAFRMWLSTDGKEPGKWLELARKRAREALTGRDPRAIYAAIEFLQNGDKEKSRDDRPAETMARVGEILSAARQAGVRAGGYDYQFDGRVLPMTINNWIERVGYYGTQARPHVRAILRIDEEIAVPSGRRIDQMCRIGGEEVVKYLVRRLPELERREAAAQVDAREFPDQLTEQRLAAVSAAVKSARWTIARWTGKVFESTDQMRAWWEDNSTKAQGTWLRESLEETAGKADRGDAVARDVIKAAVPDVAKTKDGDLLAQWVKAKQPYFSYDEAEGIFRVDPKAVP